MFYEWRGRYQEGEAAFRLAAGQLASPESGAEYRLLARVLAWQGHFNQVLGRSEHVDQLLQQSLFLLSSSESTDQEPVLRSSKDVRAEQAFVLRVMGWGASSREEARRLYEQSLDLYRALGDCWGTALALASLGENAWFLGDYDQAKQLYAESLAIRRIMGDQRGIAASLKSLGGIIKNEGQLEEAERLLRESLALCRELGDWPAVAHNLFLLGVTLEFAGKFAESRPPLGESLHICNHLGDRGGVVRAYEQLRFGEIMLGQYQQARTLIETAQPIYEEVGRSDWVGWSLVDLGLIAIAEKAYAVAKQWLQESVTIFRETEHPFAIADSLGHLVYAERGLGHTLQARQYLTEALRIATEVGAAYPLWETLPAAALLLADQGELERAVELYALASCYPLVANSRWFEDVAGQYIAVVAATLPPEVVAAAQERGQARDLWEMARELLVEFED
jgi:tetratricopeptide (TPR) repeat protein